MKQVAHERYETFDQHRRSAEARAADTHELAALERLEKRLSSEKRNADLSRIITMRAPEEEGIAP